MVPDVPGFGLVIPVKVVLKALSMRAASSSPSAELICKSNLPHQKCLKINIKKLNHITINFLFKLLLESNGLILHPALFVCVTLHIGV